jgi:hypoxanthine-guanine phosphoribosyltransferase
MKVEIVDVMFDEATIAGKVKELADRISLDYAGKD